MWIFVASYCRTESLMKKMLEMRQARPVDAGTSNKVYSREGYLFLMEKKAFGTTWTKQYCMYQRDKKEFIMIPYNQMTGKFNSQEKMILGSCVRRMSDSIEKRFCFDLTPEDRPSIVYTLQALSEEDRKLWMDVMDGKEPTYGLPGPVKTQKSEERSLDESGFIFVQKCIEILESRGLEEQGLYRVVGVRGKVNKLLEMGLDRRKLEKLNLEDPCEWESKTITSALKTYLRNLTEPLMTFRYHNAFITAAKLETRVQRVNVVHCLTHKVPEQNFKMLDTLVKHLNNVTQHSDKNLMTVSNLSVCFGPTLLRPEEETVAAIMDIKFCNVVVEILIENYNKIFKSQPETPEVESRESSPQANPPSPPTPPHPVNLRHNKYSGAPPVTYAVTKTYYDGPLAVSLSSSLHNVATSSANVRDYGPPTYHVSSRTPARVTNNSVPAFSDTNIHSLTSHLQSSYTSPQHHKPLNPSPYYYSGIVNSDHLNSTSSSNESVSSLSSRDVSNHINYATVTPQKTKRGGNKLGMGLHYATSYRPQDNVRVRTLYACMGENDGELSFEPNQIITNVRTSVEPGWLEGTLNGKTGLVPENYVELLP